MPLALVAMRALAEHNLGCHRRNLWAVTFGLQFAVVKATIAW